MSRLNDLIASIHSSLHSFTGVQEQVTYLTAACDANQTILPVGSSEHLQRGIAEIEDELIYVDSVDSSGLILPPFGRGFRGSVAAAHPINSVVTYDPPFPRKDIRSAIDSCVEGLFPSLYQVKSTTIQYDPSKVGFALPADCEGVLDVMEEAPSSVNYWHRLGRWAYDPTSGITGSKALSIFEEVRPWANLKVTYRAKFGAFVSGTDTLPSVGLSESYADLILYGVTARLIRFLDPSRLQLRAVENLSRAGVVAVGDAGKVANQLYAMYQQRLTEERTRLLALTPPSINFTR